MNRLPPIRKPSYGLVKGRPLTEVSLATLACRAAAEVESLPNQCRPIVRFHRHGPVEGHRLGISARPDEQSMAPARRVERLVHRGEGAVYRQATHWHALFPPSRCHTV